MLRSSFHNYSSFIIHYSFIKICLRKAIKIIPSEGKIITVSDYSPEYLSSISIQEPTVKATSAQ